MATNQRAQITMDEDEVRAFVEQQRTATIATVGPTGVPHLVAMWYAVIDGQIWFETKPKSQKVTNVRRDPKVSFLAEAGLTYNELRGVSIEGQARISDDAEELWKVGVSVFERYMGVYTEEMKPIVETMLHNRVAIAIDVERVRTWDHRKLGLGDVPIGGTTAPPSASTPGTSPIADLRT